MHNSAGRHEKLVAVNVLGTGRGWRTGVENGEENHAAKDKPCEDILTSGEKYKAKTPIPQEKLRVVQ